MGHPSVHPTGTTVYKPEKCYNGYTIYSAKDHGAVLVDMNGSMYTVHIVTHTNMYHSCQNRKK